MNPSSTLIIKMLFTNFIESVREVFKYTSYLVLKMRLVAIIHSVNRKPRG